MLIAKVMPRWLVPVALPVAIVGAFAAACIADRREPEPPRFDTSIGAIFAARCKACHSGTAGWSGESYLRAIACTKAGDPVASPPDERSPIARALSDSTHANVLPSSERDAVLAWVRAGAPKHAGGAHAPGFVDPRSSESHGRALRVARWRPMLDAAAEGACGRCHDGTPSGRPEGVTSSAPRATACTSCHTGPEGPLACATCHGDGARSAPPRDTCFFPEDRASAGAHLAHVARSSSREDGVACSACHPTPSASAPLAAPHADGVRDVTLAVAHPGAPAPSFDPATKRCATTCHARPGAKRGAVAWGDVGKLGCGDCHGAPPAEHYAGPCSSCHREANAEGTALAGPKLHANGKVDLGDGSGKCGACHGSGDDPWPTTGAHAAHRSPKLSAAVACESCHEVPKTSGAGSGHPRGGGAKVAFSGLATARGQSPTYENGSCKNVYCHGAGVTGSTSTTPSWKAPPGSVSSCTSCHPSPPGAPHTGVTACAACHSSVVDVGPTGDVFVWAPSRHVNGATDR